MCQKQMQMLKELGVNVEAKNNKNYLICKKDDLIVDYYPTREFWFIRGDATKYFGFEEMLKRFKQLEEKPKDFAINSEGLTALDYFATHAMEGMVTDVVIDPQQIAKQAYDVAEAMMREREVRRGH